MRAAAANPVQPHEIYSLRRIPLALTAGLVWGDGLPAARFASRDRLFVSSNAPAQAAPRRPTPAEELDSGLRTANDGGGRQLPQSEHDATSACLTLSREDMLRGVLRQVNPDSWGPRSCPLHLCCLGFLASTSRSWSGRPAPAAWRFPHGRWPAWMSSRPTGANLLLPRYRLGFWGRSADRRASPVVFRE